MENKAYMYAEKVLSGEITAPSQIRKQCENFIREYDVLQHQDDHDFYWNHDTEQDIIQILQLLNFARGQKAMQSIGENLALWQWFLILNTFCWQHKAFPGKRKITEVIVTVSRKNSKSILACLIHIIAFFLDDPNATHYVASNTKQQADIIFEELGKIIASSPMMAPLFNIKKTYIEFLPKSGKIKSMSGDSRRADGTMSYVASVDECGADNNISKMIASISTGQFGPRNPLIIKISTSYGIENSYNYWQEVVDTMIKNTMNNNSNHRQFGLAYLIDNPKDIITVDGVEMERWEDKSTWLESNPLVAEVPALKEKLYEDYETKKGVPIDFHEFRIKNLNIWMASNENSDDYFVDQDTLEQYKNENVEDWNWWKGKKQVMIGLDLSLSTDNTAATFMWHDHDNNKTYLKNLVFYPKSREAKKIKAEGLPYDQWSKIGWCVPFGDKTVDLDNLGPYIHDIVKTYNIGVGTVLYDRKYSPVVIKYIAENIPMEMAPHDVEQNAYVLGPVISEFQRAIYDGNVSYAPNKLLESAFTNGQLTFPKGKPYIKKENKDRNKIDSLFSSFNAYKGVMYFIEDNRYESTSPLMSIGGRY